MWSDTLRALLDTAQEELVKIPRLTTTANNSTNSNDSNSNSNGSNINNNSSNATNDSDKNDNSNTEKKEESAPMEGVSETIATTTSAATSPAATTAATQAQQLVEVSRKVLRLNLDEADVPVFKKLIEYMYTGTCPYKEEEVGHSRVSPHLFSFSLLSLRSYLPHFCGFIFFLFACTVW